MRSEKQNRTAPPAKAALRPAVWLLILALGIVCFGVAALYAARSPGTYQDDDVDRYYLARQALDDPKLFLDRWGMPLPLLLFAIPARLAGYPGVEFTTALLTAAAAVMTAFAGRAVGLRMGWLAVALFFFQPIVLELSFSALGEPIAACLVAGILWSWYAGRKGVALILAGLLPLARIDALLITALVLAFSWRDVSWLARISVLLPLLAWNLLGFVASGDPFFLLAGGGSRPLNSLGPLHYTQNAIVVLGPVPLFFLLWAMVGRTQPGERSEGRFPHFALVLVLAHWALLMLLAFEPLRFGRSVGFLRHVMTTAPAVALVALWGATDWVDRRSRPRAARTVFAVAWTAVTALFLSHVLIAHAMVGEGRVEWRWVVTAVLAALGLLLLWFKWQRGRRHAVAVVGTACVVWSLGVVRPIGLDAERKAIQQAIGYFEQLGLQDSVVYTNHPWFAFLSGRDRYDLERTPHLTLEALESASTGSVVLWENHYGHRLWGNVPKGHLEKDDRFQELFHGQGGWPDTFYVFAYQKVK